MNIGMWTFLTIICVAGIVAGVLEKWIKYNRQDAAGRQSSTEILDRFDAMERRLANLESICVEQERTRKFDDELIRAAVADRE